MQVFVDDTDPEPGNSWAVRLLEVLKLLLTVLFLAISILRALQGF